VARRNKIVAKRKPAAKKRDFSKIPADERRYLKDHVRSWGDGADWETVKGKKTMYIRSHQFESSGGTPQRAYEIAEAKKLYRFDELDWH
jgi:hypothetical protein